MSQPAPDRAGAAAPSPFTRVRRLPERGRYDRDTLYAILDAGFVCHVGHLVDGRPVVIPTAYWREGDHLYFHGSSASRMLRTVSGDGIPCCVTVTHVDGLVLARSAFHHSVNYRSVMIFGTAEPVTEEGRKRAALRAFVERLVPGRWDTLRPMTDQEVKATTVLRIGLGEASAKVRTGPPKDDEEDYELPIWAGVLPLATMVGEPEPDARLAPGIEIPGHVSGFRLSQG